MKKQLTIAFCVITGLLVPLLANAQGTAGEIKGLQSVLDQLYNEMIGMSSRLISVGRGIAGFAALWYIAYRVWRHIANAESIDFYSLLRPFVLGLAIMLFPSFLAIINGILKPTVTGTAAMVQGSDKAIAQLLKQKEDAIKKTDFWQMFVGESGMGDRDKWYKYTHGEDPSGEGTFASIGNDVKFAMSKAMYNFRNSVKEWMSEILQILFQAAALCINTLRTFQLIVLAILGPLVLGISVFDGFHHSLNAWLARYINVFLWLPVANIFGAIIGKVQEQMIKMDLSQIQSSGDTFFSSKDTAYLIFLIIGIIGYCTVPSIANFIVNVGGGGALSQKITSMTNSSMGSFASRSYQTARSIKNAPGSFMEGYAGTHTSSGMTGAAGRSIGYGGAYMADKISGSSKNNSSNT
jgi:conjugative transposon TraJ protein